MAWGERRRCSSNKCCWTVTITASLRDVLLSVIEGHGGLPIRWRSAGSWASTSREHSTADAAPARSAVFTWILLATADLQGHNDRDRRDDARSNALAEHRATRARRIRMTRLAQASGIETPTRAVRLERTRPKKGRNRLAASARPRRAITKMKDGRTAIRRARDVETGATVQPIRAIRPRSTVTAAALESPTARVIDVAVPHNARRSRSNLHSRRRRRACGVTTTHKAVYLGGGSGRRRAGRVGRSPSCKTSPGPKSGSVGSRRERPPP